MEKFIGNLLIITVLSFFNLWICHDFLKPELGSDTALTILFTVELAIAWYFRKTVAQLLGVLVAILLLLIKIAVDLFKLPFYLIGRAMAEGKQSVEKNK